MKIRTYCAHLLPLGMFFSIHSMNKIKQPNIKPNILSNILKPAASITPKPHTHVHAKNYSSNATFKPVSKNTQPFKTTHTPLINKNLLINKNFNQAYRQYSTGDKSEYAKARTTLAQKIMVRRKIRALMEQFRYGTTFGNHVISQIVKEAQKIKNSLEIEQFVRTELSNLYDSNNSKILSERIIQNSFINEDFHWLLNPIKSLKSGVSQYVIKALYDESIIESVDLWKKQMREDMIYREQFIAETIKQVSANASTLKKFKNFFFTQGDYFISEQTKKEIVENNKEIIIDEKNNPQKAEEIVSQVIEQWVKEKKPFLRKNPRNGFFESIDQKKRNNNEQNQTSSRTKQFLRKFWWVAPVALWLWPEKDKTVSKTPLKQTESPAYYTQDLYIYALDSTMALTMDPDNFVKQLHAVGLTVEDAVKIQCQIQEESSYKALSAAANLSEYDWNLLHNILKLRYEFLNGNYKEENVTFEGITDTHVIAMVKNALKKANIPFKVMIHSNPKKQKETSLGSAATKDDLKNLYIGNKKTSVTYMMGESALEFKYHLETGTAGICGKTIVGEIYLSPKLLSTYSREEQKAVIAHEVTHTANLHNLQRIFFHNYVTKIKALNQSTYDKCKHILSTIFEYQADLLPLTDPEYAEAQKFYFQDWSDLDIRSDIYITPRKLHMLASRAVDLHAAEHKIVGSNKK